MLLQTSWEVVIYGATKVTIIAQAARIITIVTITPMSYTLFTARIVLLLVGARALADGLRVSENSVCILGTGWRDCM